MGSRKQLIFDPEDIETQINPYPFYPLLRDNSPLLKSSFLGQPCWILSRRKDISAVLMDPVTYSNKTAPLPSMLFQDPPAHGRLRKMVSNMFTRAAVQAQAGAITVQAEALIQPALAVPADPACHDPPGRTLWGSETSGIGHPVAIGVGQSRSGFFPGCRNVRPGSGRTKAFVLGQGIHTCLGNWLARLEAAIALKVGARHVARITLDSDRPSVPLMGGTFNEFGFVQLPVILEPR